MLARVSWSPRCISAAKPKQRNRQLNQARRRHLIDTVALIMRDGFEDGAPSRFAFEGACRHGVRAGLCLDGWPWHDADRAAEDVVSRALAMIGATRPTWKEGQPEWTQDGHAPIERESCIRCRKPLPEGHWKFCSELCTSAFHADQSRRRRGEELNAYARARYAAGIKAPRLAPRPCEECGAMFVTRRKETRFCSKKCASQSHKWRMSYEAR